MNYLSRVIYFLVKWRIKIFLKMYFSSFLVLLAKWLCMW